MNNWNELVNTIKNIDDAKVKQNKKVKISEGRGAALANNIRNSATVASASNPALSVASDVATTAGNNSAARSVAGKIGSGALKVAGPAAAAYSFYDAYERWKKGDRSGAVIAALSGGLGLIPTPPTIAASVGLSGYGAYRDYQQGKDEENKQKSQTASKNKATAAPAAAPAKPVAATPAPVAATPTPVAAAPVNTPVVDTTTVDQDEENNDSQTKPVSESEKIALLRNKLDNLDKAKINENQLAEGIFDLATGGVKLGIPALRRLLGPLKSTVGAADDVAGAADDVAGAAGAAVRREPGALAPQIEIPASAGSGARTPAQQAGMDAAAGRATTGAPAGAPAGGSTLTKPGPNATEAELAAYRAARQKEAQAAADRTARPKPDGASGGSGGGSPPGGRSGATAEPVPATATGGAGGAGGGGGSPPTVTPPASPPPSGGAGGGAGGAGGAVGRPAEVASDVGRPTSTGGTVYDTPTGIINRAGPNNPNATTSGASGAGTTGGPLANPANTTVATRQNVPATGGASGAGTTGGPLANPANTTVATRQNVPATGGASSADTTGSVAGTAGGGAGRTVAAGAAGIATGAGINAVLNRPATPGTDTSDQLDYTQITTDMQGTTMSPEGNYVRPGTRPSDYAIAGGGRPGVQDTAATAASAPAATAATTTAAPAATTTQGQQSATPATTVSVPSDTSVASVEAPRGSGLRRPDTDLAPNVKPTQQGSQLPDDFISRTTPQGFRFTPQQEEWLTRGGGNPNRQDPYILQRMARSAGGPLPPLSYFKDPEDQVIARRLGFPGGQQTQAPQTQRPQAQQQAQQQAQPQTQASQPFSFSPAQEAWLTRGGGNPNRQDPYILQRMVKSAGGSLPPVSYFKDPQDQAIAKRIGFPMNESNSEITRLKELIRKI